MDLGLPNNHVHTIWVLTNSKRLVSRVLADDFPFLPSQILASAFPALDCSRRVSHSTFPTDLHVEPMLLSKRLLEGIHYRQIRHSPYAKLSYESNQPRPKYVFPTP
jgi:hypothetical protein